MGYGVGVAVKESRREKCGVGLNSGNRKVGVMVWELRSRSCNVSCSAGVPELELQCGS